MMPAMQLAGMRKRWEWHHLDGQARSSCDRLASQLAVDPLVAVLLYTRGVTDGSIAKGFLAPRLTDLHEPGLLPGADRAAQRICKAVEDGQPIVVYGDYDVDGITAAAILWHVLKLAGARVSVYVPHRVEEGYGLNNQAIAQLASDKPLIISVDCGITAVEPARVAKESGIDLIITDHHEFDAQSHGPPDAHTVVHPRLPGSRYPFGDLCGAAVAFKLAWQFARLHCGSDRLPTAFRGLLVDLLSYVALGTVADVVPLVGENRVLTTHGLGQIKRTGFVGLNALIDASRLRDEKIDAYHVGFVLGPRLNACGRMGHAAQAVRLLTEAGPDEAGRIARFLTTENDRRRAVEREIFDEARQMVIEAGYDSDDCRAIVVSKEGWHPGVVGIVASRLVEAFARPAVVLNCQCEADGGQAHGSARSVDGVSIYQAIEHCAGLLTSFGGHAMAAGVRLDAPRVEEFRRQLVAYVNEHLGPEDLVHTLRIDAPCTLEDVRLDLFDQVYRLAPFGRANPWPVLCVRGVTTDRPAQRIGGQGRHLRLMLRQGGRLVSAVAFGMGDLAEQLPAGVELDVAFEPKLSVWQGRRRAEVHVKDLRIV